MYANSVIRRPDILFPALYELVDELEHTGIHYSSQSQVKNHFQSIERRQ